MAAPLTIAAMEVNWIALVLIVLGLFLAFKLIGAALKLLMWLVVLAGAYWFVAPMMGWPTLSDVVYVFGPDFDGQRIEEVLRPERIAGGLGERVVDGVVERWRELPAPLGEDGVVPEPELPPDPAGDGGSGAEDRESGAAGG